MAPNLPKLRPGDVVAGRFRIVEMIGSGGFSVVYRAHQEEMNRFVALKILKPKASHDAKIVERFRREALYASNLSHPNTITLFDYGHTDNGLCFIAMEHLVGCDLSAIVQTHEQMDLKRVWKILVQCCRSLAEAHRLGLVHRDLKPENIFLCQREDGEFVKVLDFGVSKAISEFGDAGPNTLAPLTQEGTVFGTPLYMAPEQAMAESISPAVDVYALGHMAFEMITGHAAYENCTNAMDVMLRQINDPPLALPEPWSHTPFSKFITAATQKDPIHRIADAHLLLDALMSKEFDPYMDPAERPSRQRTLPRVPSVGGDTDPDMSEAQAQEVYRWELGVLEESLAECQSQLEPRVVIIRGRPGTGRSNLLRAFMRTSMMNSDLTILHRSADNEDTSLENELSVLTGVPLRGRGITEVKRILGQLFGDDDELSRTADELGTDSRPLNTLTTVRETLLTRIAEPFRARAEKAPIIWGIESLEQMDTLSLAFLDRFFRDLQAHPAPVMIVATVYPEDIKRRPGLLRYTQGLLQAGRPIARQLSLVPPGERKEEHHQTDEDLLAAQLAKLPADLPVDGSYLGAPLADDPDEESDHTDRLVMVDSPDAVGSAFDRVLGYLAQLGDEVPSDLWKLVYARILDTELIRLVDTIMSQAEKFGILHRSDDMIRFSKPGFAEMLRSSFEDLDDSGESHGKLADLMLQFFATPTTNQTTMIVQHLVLAGRSEAAVEFLFTTGEKAFQNLDLDAARESYLQIQKLVDVAPDSFSSLSLDRARLWLRLGEIHGALGEHGAAEDALRRALGESKVDDHELIGKARKLLGDLATSQNRYNDALKSFEKARECYRNLGQARPFVAITSEMGRCALMQGRSALAEDLSRQALEMAQKLRDPILVARVNRRLGQVLTRRGRFLEAVEHLEESMSAFENQNRETEGIECMIELGNASYASAHYPEAREHHTRAIAMSAQMRVSSGIEPHLGLARALAALENLDQAEAHLAEALARSGSSRDLSFMGEIRLYQGDIHLARRRPEIAIEHYKEVMEISESVGMMNMWIWSVIRLAYAELDRENESAVFQYLGKALQRAEKIGDRDGELQVRAHIIYVQMLEHGFPASGDTFDGLLESTARDDEIGMATVLSYLFRADVMAARQAYSEARDYLRYAHTGAAQLGDFAIFIPIARRLYLLQKEAGQLGDPHAGSGFAIGSMIPPETGKRRFVTLPKAR